MGYKYKSSTQLGYNTARISSGVNTVFKMQAVVAFSSLP